MIRIHNASKKAFISEDVPEWEITSDEMRPFFINVFINNRISTIGVNIIHNIPECYEPLMWYLKAESSDLYDTGINKRTEKWK